MWRRLPQSIVPRTKATTAPASSPTGCSTSPASYRSTPITREAPPGGIEAHTRLALANVERVLKDAGLSRSDIVQCRVYVSDIDEWEAVNRVYAEFFGDHKPAAA